VGAQFSILVALSLRQSSEDHGSGAGYRLPRHKHLNTTMRYIDVNDVKLQNAVEIFSF